METIKVKKQQLLDSLKANREKYIVVRDAARIAYKLEATKKLKELLKKVSKDEIVNGISLPTFRDTISDYDNAIKMLEFSVDDIIEISDREFQAYVQNEWSWKSQFVSFANSYSGVQGTQGSAGVSYQSLVDNF